MLYNVSGALSGVSTHTELLTFSGDYPNESTFTLVAPSGSSKILGGRFSYLGWSQGPAALNLAPLGLQI